MMETGNVYQEDWKETLQDKTKEDLLEIMRKAGEYEEGFIDMVKQKLGEEHGITESEIGSNVAEYEECKRRSSFPVVYEKSLSRITKVIFIIMEIFIFLLALTRIVPLNALALLLALLLTIASVVMRNKQVKNELGDKVYFYDEKSRKWLKLYPGASLAVWLGTSLSFLLDF